MSANSSGHFGCPCRRVDPRPWMGRGVRVRTMHNGRWRYGLVGGHAQGGVVGLISVTVRWPDHTEEFHSWPKGDQASLDLLRIVRLPDLRKPQEVEEFLDDDAPEALEAWLHAD